MRIFLDANILFSAAKSDGAIHALVARLRAAKHECWVDGHVVDEARRNILAKAPDRLPRLEDVIARLNVSTVAAAIVPADVRGLPEQDRLVVAAAVALNCDALVTGDRTHFGPLYGRRVAGVRIHSPRSLYVALFPES
jgi:predicted nucleic acid-binding protein